MILTFPSISYQMISMNATWFGLAEALLYWRERQLIMLVWFTSTRLLKKSNATVNQYFWLILQ